MLAERRFFGLGQRLRMILVVEGGLGRAYGLDKLRAGAGRLVDDIQVGQAPVGGHLAAAGAGIVLGADSLQEHVDRLDAEHQAEGAVAVVGIEPVDTGTKKKPHSRGDRFVARAGDLKVDFILAFELDFAIVQPAREVHRAIKADKSVMIEAVQIGGVKLGGFDARL